MVSIDCKKWVMWREITIKVTQETSKCICGVRVGCPFFSFQRASLQKIQHFSASHFTTDDFCSRINEGESVSWKHFPKDISCGRTHPIWGFYETSCFSVANRAAPDILCLGQMVPPPLLIQAHTSQTSQILIRKAQQHLSRSLAVVVVVVMLINSVLSCQFWLIAVFFRVS